MYYICIAWPRCIKLKVPIVCKLQQNINSHIFAIPWCFISIFTQWSFRPKGIFTFAVAKVMFSSLSLARVCLFVCLSVSNITKKQSNRFSWNFQGRCDLIQKTIRNILRIFHLTLWTQDFFFTFLASQQHCRKQLNIISWNFQKKVDLTQGAIWNIFGMLLESGVDLSIF